MAESKTGPGQGNSPCVCWPSGEMDQRCPVHDEPMFEMPEMDRLDYGPSWGAIAGVGVLGLFVAVADLILAAKL